MVPANSSWKVAVLPGSIRVIVRIVPARVVPYPLVVGMDVRCFRVSRLIAETLSARSILLLRPFVGSLIVVIPMLLSS